MPQLPTLPIQAWAGIYQQAVVLLPLESSNWLLEQVPMRVGPELQLQMGFAITRSPDIFFPSVVIDDYGSILREQAALEWVARRGSLHPRSEAEGFLQYGKPANYFLRDLDLGIPPYLFVTDSPFADQPVRHILSNRTPNDIVLPELKDWLDTHWIKEA